MKTINELNCDLASEVKILGNLPVITLRQRVKDLMWDHGDWDDDVYPQIVSTWSRGECLGFLVHYSSVWKNTITSPS